MLLAFFATELAYVVAAERIAGTYWFILEHGPEHRGDMIIIAVWGVRIS